MTHPTYRTDEDKVVKEICVQSICTTARFVLDKPLILTKDMVLTLEQGKFYVNGEEREGMWKDMRG
jgi:hypothetical protein